MPSMRDHIKNKTRCCYAARSQEIHLPQSRKKMKFSSTSQTTHQKWALDIENAYFEYFKGEIESSFDFFLWPLDRKMKSLGPSDDFFRSCDSKRRCAISLLCAVDIKCLHFRRCSKGDNFPNAWRAKDQGLLKTEANGKIGLFKQ